MGRWGNWGSKTLSKAGELELTRFLLQGSNNAGAQEHVASKVRQILNSDTTCVCA
ncbi:MAG: hypothetical protein ACI8WB_000323 [Phenylobacterium sp.]|jgi:hypothetical protein